MKQDVANKMQVKVLIPQTDNGRSKVTLYEVDGKVIEWRYNYGKGYAFIHLTEYISLGHYENRMTQLGSKQIYNGGDTRQNGEYGRGVEFAIFEFERMEAARVKGNGAFERARKV